MFDDKLERYTGQFKLNRQRKKEVAPLFKPVKGLTNINGSVEKRDMSRYIPSNLGKKNNELPFNQVKVGPGINDGYTDKPSGGFHPTVRIMPVKPENYRVDPVFEQKGRILKGKAVTQNRESLPTVAKNRVSLLVENKNGERNFRTTGAVKADRDRHKILLKKTNRKKSKFMINPGAANTRHSNRGKTKKAHKKNCSRQQ